MTYESNASTTFSSLQAYKPTSLSSNYFSFYTSFIILFFSIITAHGQNHSYLKDVVVNPPNAAALGKYGDIPVSMHTGVPNISIPIHTLSEAGGLSVPISLSYHASGIKVVETSSWVGSNWALNAGGAITRTVRNAPDEGLATTSGRGKGWYQTSTQEIENILNTETQLVNNGIPFEATESNKMDRGEWDTEPDAFSYNVNGYTGKFYLTPGSSDVVMSNSSSDVKIYCNFNVTNKSFDYWTLITPDGNKYTFGYINKNELTGEDEAVDLTYNYVWSDGYTANKVVAAWYLTKIQSADGIHSINLNYVRERYRYTNRGSDNGESDPRSSNNRLIHNEVLGARLTSISSTFETVEFNVSTQNRLDLDITTDYFNTLFSTYSSTADRAKALDNIVIKNNPNLSYKKIKLITDYFVSYSTGFPNDNALDEYPSDKYRLRLKSVVESDIAETANSKKTYNLTYNNTNGAATTEGVMTNLPRRKSAAIDIWGLYNGRNDNTGLSPYAEVYAASSAEYGTPTNIDFNSTLGDITFQLSSYIQSWGSDAYTPFANRIFGWTGTSSPYLYSVKPLSRPNSGNRQPSAAHMMEGTLNQIDYPTGGNTQFIYEPHTYKGKIEEFKFFYPLQQQACTWCTTTSSNSYNNCTAPSGVGASCIRDIKIKNVQIASGTPTNKMLFGLSLDNLGDVSFGMGFNYFVKKNGVQIKTGSFSLPANQKKTVIVDGFLTTFWNGSTILPTDIIDIDILRTSANGTPDTLCDLKFQVFYTTFGVVDGDKIAGGCRVKQVISSDGVDNTKNIIKAYDYKDEAGVLSSGILVSKIQVVNDLAVRDQDKVWSFNEVDYVYRNSPNNDEINAPTTPVFGTRLWTVLGSPLGPPSNNQSGVVGYKNVKVTQINNLNQANDGYSKYTYNVDIPYSESNRLTLYPDVPEFSTSGKTGNLTKEEHFSIANALVRQVIYDYVEVAAFPNFTMGTVSVTGYLFPKPNKGRLKKYFIRAGYNTYLNQKTELVDGVTTTTNFIYNANWQHHNAIETTVTNSDNIPYKTKTYYAHEMGNTNLTTRNMIGIPLKTEQYVNSILKSASQTIYSDFATTSGTFPRPAQFQSLRRDATTWDTKMTVNAYETTTGFPTSATRQGFIVPETYAWTNKLLTSKTFGGLVWNYEYKLNTNMVSQTIDENRLRTKFTYDALQRLQKVDNRMKDDGSDIQATTLYDYHYRTSTSDNNYVSTSTSFVNATSAPSLSTKQYLDGLGRSVSTVRENYTPIALQNQVNMVTYDYIGRQDRSYLPFESTGIALVAGTPYAYPTYEQSPLSRPLKQTNVDGTGVTMSYGTNAASDNIRNFVFTPVQGAAGTVTNNNVYYPAALFYKTTTWDENGTFLLPSTPTTTVGKTEMYKDKLGRTILTRKFLNGTNVDTYNVYDDYGSLVMVIPPGGLDASGNPIGTLVFTYTYDSRNRLIEKKVPNADPQKFFYDDRDLLTLSQDGNMRTVAYGGNANKYLGTQYNTIGQVLKTGWVTDTTGLWTGAITITDANKLTEIQYYTNRTWVKHQAAKVLKPAGVSTVREYVWSYIERRVGYEYTGNPIWTGKQHLLSKTYVNGSTLVNADAPITDNDYGGVDWLLSGYNGLQKPTVSIRNLYCDINAGSSARTVRTVESYTFDNAQRLTNLDYGYKIGGSAVSQSDLSNMSKMSYNYKDQVTEKNTALVAGKYLQSTDFAYNLRGWLTSINNGFQQTTNDYPLFSCSGSEDYYAYGSGTYPSNMPFTPAAQSGEDNADLFTEKIRYDDPNYSFPGAGASQRNGNISQIEWQVAGKEAQGYSFKYDNLDRLTEANYVDIHSSNYSSHGWTQQYKTDNKYQEKVSYDLRGNITALERNGLTSNCMTYNGFVGGLWGKIDNLTYNYDPADLNKLTKVTDAADLTRGFKSVNNNTTYTYDANGNLTSDLNKNITGITYNYLNLPLVISFTGNNRIEFIYDATGAKLRKTTYVNNVLQTQDVRDYVNGVEYKGGVVDRFAHTEGAVVRNENGVFEHQYVIRDHLGNTRVTYRDGINKVDNTGNTSLNDGIITVSDMMQINHYYPFGMNMEGSWNGSYADAKNKYQYNGKELNSDFGLELNDYGARWYDAAIARWTSRDPLSEKYLALTPYNYVMNRPTIMIDPFGMDAVGADGLTNEQWINSSRPGADPDMATEYRNKNRQEEIDKIKENKKKPSNTIKTTVEVAEEYKMAKDPKSRLVRSLLEAFSSKFPTFNSLQSSLDWTDFQNLIILMYNTSGLVENKFVGDDAAVVYSISAYFRNNNSIPDIDNPNGLLNAYDEKTKGFSIFTIPLGEPVVGGREVAHPQIRFGRSDIIPYAFRVTITNELGPVPFGSESNNKPQRYIQMYITIAILPKP